LRIPSTSRKKASLAKRFLISQDRQSCVTRILLDQLENLAHKRFITFEHLQKCFVVVHQHSRDIHTVVVRARVRQQLFEEPKHCRAWLV
jgi:hypothetical protein